MIAATLAIIDVWYNEATVGPERPKLLSKLALLELCGWLETEQDSIVSKLDAACLKDAGWTKKEVVERTFGFDYSKHFRPMLAKLFGEHLTRKLEDDFENKHPGDLARLRSTTGTLWAKRCDFAHADMVTNVAKAQTFDAPSWSLNQHRIISKVLSRYEAEVIALAASI